MPDFLNICRYYKINSRIIASITSLVDRVFECILYKILLEDKNKLAMLVFYEECVRIFFNLLYI